MIDVVGHFGSRLSYATVSDQIVRGLMERDMLGNVTNLDDKYIDEALGARLRGLPGKNVLLIADARDYLVEAMVDEYGRDNVATFMCPNTDTLSDEHVRACRRVGLIYTPSRWCADTVYRSVAESYDFAQPPLPELGGVEVMPLGVDDTFASIWTRRCSNPGPINLLHVTTDTFWAGRKGTEELLAAWKLALDELSIEHDAHLTVHCLPQLFGSVHQELGDLDLLDVVKLVEAPIRGTTSEDLRALFEQYDMLVAPSRSEGFGIMPLSALVTGMPVLTTAGTGQDQYLKDPKLGGWMQIPTQGTGGLFGEQGEAPTISPEQLALSVRAGCCLYGALLKSVEKNLGARAEWSWTKRRARWADSLIEWASNT